MKISKKSECIRNVSNNSLNKDIDRFDNKKFDIQRFINRMDQTSPKIKELVNTINILDNYDLQNNQTLYKHIIYTDTKKAISGVKLIATGLITNGFQNVYDTRMKVFDNLHENEYNNFALLSSGTVFNKKLPITLKKNILKIFNNRKGKIDDNNFKYNNINGKNIRIVIIDQGYKEGIDLFDVKYVHILDPLLTIADEQQVVGRGTRYCGQMGLNFDTKMGWPLHVFKYDVLLNEDLKKTYDVNSINELFITKSGIDIEKLNFSKEFEKLTTYGAIDYDLTKNIHGREEEISQPISDDIYFKYHNYVENSLSRKVSGIFGGNPGRFMKIRQYIRNNFIEYEWDKIEFINKCKLEKKKRSVELTPSQKFVTEYFKSDSPFKGLFLWHSVGTGKTCSAISIASTGFEPENYTILWVTRHTLKADIWKNMFIDVCSANIKQKIKRGEKIPKDAVENPFKYLSKNWVQPISYKQFSNMLSDKNEMSKMMRKRNGSDMLKKTLIIIDEVHKLFSIDLPVIERPDYNVIKRMIRKSYEVSGKDSARILLMSATPYSNNPLDLVKFLNLLREEDLPDNYQDFSKEFLKDGIFTKEGAVKYLDNISPYISYLNREKDVQQFAYPIYYDVEVDISVKKKHLQNEMQNYIQQLKSNLDSMKNISLKDKSDEEILEIQNKIEIHQNALNEGKRKLKDIKNGIIEDQSQEYALEKCFNK
jgi:superfamily II DNA or RNA helicase